MSDPIYSLLEKQEAFARLGASLIIAAFRMGYAVTLGEAYRTPEQAAWNVAHGKGIKNSLHTQRLAIDLQLFKAGKYLDKSEDYKEMGEYWESLSTPGLECAWGGRFSKPDGNHFSVSHNGVK